MVERLGEFLADDSLVNGICFKLWLLCYSYDICRIFHDFREASIKENKFLHRISFVGCLKKISYFSAFKKIGFLRNMTKGVEMHFPEVAGPIYLVNAPSVVTGLWSMVKKFLDPDTASKVSIASNIPEDKVIALIGSDILPEEFGGTNKYKLDHATKLSIILSENNVTEKTYKNKKWCEYGKENNNPKIRRVRTYS